MRAGWGGRSAPNGPWVAGWLAAGLLAAGSGAAEADGVTLRTVSDFSRLNNELGRPQYSGVALSADGTALWFINQTQFGEVRLDGKILVHGGPPPSTGVNFGSPTLDATGTPWVVADWGSFPSPDGQVFRLLPAGHYKIVGSLPSTTGHPVSGLATDGHGFFGAAWMYDNGQYGWNLYRVDAQTGQVRNLVPATSPSAEYGKPLITANGILYVAAGLARNTTGGTYVGGYPLLRYDIAQGSARWLGFQHGGGVDNIGIFGAGTPAIDQFGTVYVAVARERSVVPYSDLVIGVAADGTAAPIATLPNLNNDFNTFSGLVFDPVHKRLYGGYYEINGADYAKSNPGTIFCYDPASRHFASIFTFNGYDGALPVGDFAIDATGTKLYGATSGGGKAFDGSAYNSGFGTLFELSLGATPPC